ncbi:MAG: ExeM/NucH family extracellular endonuclease [Actinomycetota bacterium]
MASSAAVVSLVPGSPVSAATTALFEDFEDATVGYSTSTLEFSDGFGDYFTRTDGTNIGSFVEVTGNNGSYWYGAQDIDAEGATPPFTMTFTGVDITGLTNLAFSVLLAEDDDGAAEDWDLTDSVLFEYAIDGGGFNNLLAVESIPDGDPFNAVPAIDTDFDGDGDGDQITATFSEFTAPIANTGSALDLRITFNLDSGDEDINLDDITITGDGTLADTFPTLLSSTPPNGGSAQSTDGLQLVFSEPVTVPEQAVTPWVELACNGPVAVTISGGPSTYTVTPSAPLPPGESCTATLLAAQIADQDGDPDLLNDGTNEVISFEVTRPCSATPTLISTIQGDGLASPLDGQVRTIEGIVVGDFQYGAAGTSGDLNGFFVQEETSDEDAFETTSEGLFVSDGSSPAVDVAPGDTVQVTGTVDESFGQTQLGSVTLVEVCSTDTSLADVTRRQLTLPFTALDAPEAFEGMAVEFPQDLVISEYFNFDRFGEIVLSEPLPGEDRIFQPTAVETPGSTAAQDRADYNARSRITLDDGRTTWNPDPAIHPDGTPFTVSNRFRGGDTVTDATGVLSYSFGLYRIQPTQGATHSEANPRPAGPPDVGGSLTVASFNVLNYFTTIDDGSAICGPGSDLECRGADSMEEFIRQQTKIVDALADLDADIIGLIELENNVGADPAGDGTDPVLQTLVDALNAVVGAGTYDFVDAGAIGTDAIKVAFIYKPATVTPVGDPEILDSSADATFLDTKNRPVLVQTFEEVASGERFTAAINHFKSKGSSCDDVGDPTDPNGQGNCNGVRTDAAAALASFLAGDPTSSSDPDFLILGDLNAYDEEDPITTLEAAGYVDLEGRFVGEFGYGYVFDGQLGYLDYALANPSLNAQVNSAASWLINADEPDILDYDTSFKQLPQINTFETNEFRSSDHDPVVVGLSLGPTCSGRPGECPPERGPLEVTKTVDWSGSTPDGTRTFEICIQGPSYPDGGEPGACQSIGSNGGVVTWAELEAGAYTVTETNPGADWNVEITGSPATVTSEATASAAVTNTFDPPQSSTTSTTTPTTTATTTSTSVPPTATAAPTAPPSPQSTDPAIPLATELPATGSNQLRTLMAIAALFLVLGLALLRTRRGSPS